MRGPRAVVALFVVVLIAACAGRRDTTTAVDGPPGETTTTIPTSPPDPLWAVALHLRSSYVELGMLDEQIIVTAAVTALAEAADAGSDDADAATAGEQIPEGVPSGYEPVWRLWRLLEQARPELASRDTLEEAVGAMIGSVGDPNSRVFVDVVVADDGHIDDVYQGIGAFVEEEDGFVVVTLPFPGGPAARAGILAGDIVIGVNGESVEGLTLSEVVALVRGPAGSIVRLLLTRPGVGEVEVAVAREGFTLSTARFRMLADGIAYLSLSGLESRTVQEVERELDVMAAHGIRGLVIDLRGNAGGSTRAAIAVAEHFLDGGTIFHEENLDGMQTSREATPGGVFSDLPIAMLIDGRTTGAAELLAAALRDHLRGPLIGSPTAGQALLYRGHDVGQGIAVVVPSGVWSTPGGQVIAGLGLPPDFQIELIPEAVAAGEDIVINAGFAYLWSLLEDERGE